MTLIEGCCEVLSAGVATSSRLSKSIGCRSSRLLDNRRNHHVCIVQHVRGRTYRASCSYDSACLPHPVINFIIHVLPAFAFVSLVLPPATPTQNQPEFQPVYTFNLVNEHTNQDHASASLKRFVKRLTSSLYNVAAIQNASISAAIAEEELGAVAATILRYWQAFEAPFTLCFIG